MVAVIESRPLAPSQAQLPNRDRASAGGRIRRQQLKYSNRYSPIKKVHPYHQHTPNTTVWSRTCKAFGTITNTQRTVSNHNGRYNELTPNEHIVSFKKIPTMIDSFGRSSPSTGRRWPMPANKVDGLASSAKLKLDFDENNNQFDEESNLIDTDITLVSMSYTLVPEANESMFNESYSTFAANAILTSTMIEAGTSAAEKRSKRKCNRKQKGQETSQKNSMNVMNTVTGLNRFIHIEIDRIKRGILKMLKPSAKQSQPNMSEELLIK